MEHDESRTRQISRQNAFVAEIRRRFQHPGFAVASVKLPLQIPQQICQVSVRVVALLALEPREKTGHLEISDRPVRVQGVFQEIGILFGILRGHVVRRVGCGIEARTPFEELSRRVDPRIRRTAGRSWEGGRIEALPEEQLLKVAAHGQKLMQFGRAYSWKSADDERRLEHLLENLRMLLE